MNEIIDAKAFISANAPRERAWDALFNSQMRLH